MNGLFTVEAKIGNSLADLTYHDEWRSMSPDILRLLASHNFDTRGTYTSSTLSYDNQPTWRTIVKPSPSYLDALGLFFNTLSGGPAVPDNPIHSSWKTRERMSMSGVVYPGGVYSRKVISDFYPNTVSGLMTGGGQKVGVITSPDGMYISADSFFDTVNELFETHGSGFSTVIWPLNSLATNAGDRVEWNPFFHFELFYKVKSISNDHVDYEVDIYSLHYMNYPGFWNGMKTRYRCKIARNVLQPWNLTISQDWGPDVFDGLAIHLVPFPEHPNPNNWLAAGNAVTRSDWRDGDLDINLKNAFSSVPFSVMACSAGLYHTQSRAYASLLGSASDNFESFVESPDFFGSILEIAKSPTPWLESFLPTGITSPIARARFLVKLVCGIYIGWIFAISPALTSARDAFKRFMNSVSIITGKGALLFEGDKSTLDSLPDGLRKLLSFRTDSDLATYSVRLGSQVYATPTADKVTGVFESMLEEASRIGVEPDPTYLYAMLPFTFVFDWKIPMGALMKDAYNRYRLIGKRGIVAGHSVSVDITYEDGVRLRVYLRSVATVLMIDPQVETWLTAAVPPSVAVPLALLLIL